MYEVFKKRWWLGSLLIVPLLVILGARDVAGMYYNGYYHQFREARTVQDCDKQNLGPLSHVICAKVAERLSWEESDPAACEAQHDFDYESCIGKIAANLKDVSFCDRLSSSAVGSHTSQWNNGVYGHCVMLVARATSDQKLCDLLTNMGYPGAGPGDCIRMAKIGPCDFACIRKEAAAAKDVHKCDKLLDPTVYTDKSEYGFCVNKVAEATKNPKLCDLLNDVHGFAADRKSCLGFVGQELHDKKICDVLKDEKERSDCVKMVY